MHRHVCLVKRTTFSAMLSSILEAYSTRKLKMGHSCLYIYTTSRCTYLNDSSSSYGIYLMILVIASRFLFTFFNMLLSYDINICSFMRARLVANTEHNGKKYNTILSLELETASANPSMRSSIRSLYLMNHNN